LATKQMYHHQSCEQDHLPAIPAACHALSLFPQMPNNVAGRHLERFQNGVRPRQLFFLRDTYLLQ